MVVERSLQLLPDADVVRLDNVGHYPQLEAPGFPLRSAGR